MATVIAVANQKGGVGKTTTAVNLGAAFARKRKRTLLLDLDPQANTTLTFFPLEEVPHSVYDVLADHQKTLAEIVKPTKYANLAVAPAMSSVASWTPSPLKRNSPCPAASTGMSSTTD